MKLKLNPLFADACGNTFLIFDCLNYLLRDEEWATLKKEIGALLEKSSADDALLLQKTREEEDLIKIKMHVLERDGTEADFCGNGARTVGQFLHQKYRKQRKKMLLESRHGDHHFTFKKGSCSIEMGRPILEPTDKHLDLDKYQFRFVDCVEPHLVTQDFFDAKELTHWGEKINRLYPEKFPHGVNVNCFRILDRKRLEVLTFERGVYRITQACGTGSTACTKMAIENNLIDTFCEITIHVLGGELTVRQIADGSFWLGGPVKIIF